MSFNSLYKAVATRSIHASRIHSSRIPTTANTNLLFRCTYSSTADDPSSTENFKNKKPTNEEDPSKDKNPDTSIETTLKQQLAEKDKKLVELQDAYVRCLADQENLRERNRKELAAAKEFAIQKFAKDILDTVDILNMALMSVPEDLRTKEEAQKATHNMVDQLTNLYVGVSMTEVELVKALQRHGVDRHDPHGEVFDPNRHQALFQAPMPDKQPGTIFTVQKLGYTLKGRVLRPAQVGVVAESD